jgi:phosphatidylglycerophosphate synthase
MRTVQRWPAAGLAAQAGLLVVLALTVGPGTSGTALGGMVALAVTAALAVGLRRSDATRFGPANAITLTRASLVVGVAALVPEHALSRGALVGLAGPALVLDLVDGRVARATGSVTRLGARFDMETDALLILLLSVSVVGDLGWSAGWVLLIGTARYLLWLAERAVPWLRKPTPVRPWAKVVAAVQGVLLVVACSRLLPTGVALALLAVGLLLLAESFAWQVRWLARHREGTERAPVTAVTVCAAILTWAALVMPDRTTDLSGYGFARIPIEAAVLLAVVAALPRRTARVVAAAAGTLLAAVVVLKVLDIGFIAAFDRPFDPYNDWYFFGPGIGVLSDSIGRGDALLTVGAAVLLVLMALTLLPLCLVRLGGAAHRSRRRAFATATAITIAWVVTAVLGVDTQVSIPMASSSTATEAVGEITRLRSDIADRAAFARALADDPYAAVSPSLGGLRGKDVLLVFIESYGRVAVQGSDFSASVDAALDRGTSQLRAAGYDARSAFLTSPTFGGASWLAHSTLESGLWVDAQQRYVALVGRSRLTLASAFKDAGWRTVLDTPSNTGPWPQGQRFYRFDKLYGAHDVGYRGPRFSYASMPDQYTLAAFRRLELLPHPRRPVMAEIDLVSSHTPWTPLPHLIPWEAVGDGSAYAGMPAEGLTPSAAFRHAETVKRLYGQSIVYTWQSLVSFLTHYRDPNLVVIALGDHQPHSEVSGTGPNHDVPISVIAHDPHVFDAISGWNWQTGLRPRPDAPVWRMDRFRDAFFAAFDRD